MKITNIVVPAAQHTRESNLAFSAYPDTQGLALLLVNKKTGEHEATASVNVESYGAPKLPNGEVWLKGWSENEGIPEALEQAGAIELTGDTWATSYCFAQQAKLIGRARDMALDFLPPDEEVTKQEPEETSSEETRELGELIPSEIFNHPHCFSSSYYDKWEKEIAEPILVEKGYKVLRWYSSDADSFGPLVRAVVVEKDGVEQTFCYG